MFHSLHFSSFVHYNIWRSIKFPMLLITFLSPAYCHLFSCNSTSPQRLFVTQPQNMYFANWEFQPKVIHLLQPTGYVMHHQFNIQQLYVLSPHCIYVFCIYLRTNSDLCHLQHKLIGFCNRDEKCLQRGTDWVFK